ncbi:MAG: prepilin-type N-terminal cleavage/methylation domain-containing protein [Candidatus Omnitrophica bacterium]|nr:prepilin-type N-terminal cleavage/methylation domain-containing protein [Candidatus Omnitrophota bacterium]
MSALRSNRGFTLIELLVIIIIIGVLATVGIKHYGHLFEKSRANDAKQALWEVRVALAQYIMDHRNPPADMADLNLPDIQFPRNCRAEKFFRYSINDTHAIATRCTSGGKAPQGPSAYTLAISLTNSTWGGTSGYY